MSAEMRQLLDQQALQDRLAGKAASVEGANVLYYGRPGTGKTFTARNAHADKFNGLYMTTITLDTPAAEGRGFFIPVSGKTGTEMGWQDGMMVRAMGKVIDKDGNTKIDEPTNRLVLNEIHKLGADLAALVHAVTDDRDIAEIALPNGDVAFAQPDFQCIATSNDPPSALDEPIQDRFSIRVRMDLPSEAAIEALPTDLQEFSLKVAGLDGDRYISYREVKMFGHLRTKFSPLEAAQMVWDGTKGPGAGQDILDGYSIAGAGVVR